MTFATVRIEGGLLSQEILEDIAAGKPEGQRSEDFGLEKGRRLIDEIGAVWSDARVYWEAFQRTLARLREDDPATTPTREQWIRPLLAAMGYGKMPFFHAIEVDGRSFALSHRAGDTLDAPPVHIEGLRTSLDRRPPSGLPRISPHALVQEYLNRTDHLWGIVTNGETLRLLRDSPSLSRQTYVEFDLRQLMEAERFSEFALFYRLLHRTRLPQAMADAPDCLLERYHVHTVETGGRVRERLRDGVENALRLLGSELPAHNPSLAAALSDGTLTAETFYRRLLRLIYRLLFLMVGEERGLVGPFAEPHRSIYTRFYSVRRLRDLAERMPYASERHSDLWRGLVNTFEVFSREDTAAKLNLQALDGGLFQADRLGELRETRLPNQALLDVIRELSLFSDGHIHRRVNYGALDVEELGSVYESLLELHPAVVPDARQGTSGAVKLDLLSGSERKTTGSYYTPRELVNELVESALVPVIKERIAAAGAREGKRAALLSLSVCDPACGSGHFLLAAARRIGVELARLDADADTPSPAQVREATREVVRHCIYGVDLNPLAVDLCQVALWIEGHSAGKPLSFLDHRIRCGNSLVGVLDLKALQDGIPDEAFAAVTGDQKSAAAILRKRNKTERDQSLQNALPLEADPWQDRSGLAREHRQIAAMGDDTPDEVRMKQIRYEESHHSVAWERDWEAANLWTAAFFAPLHQEEFPAAISTLAVRDRLARLPHFGSCRAAQLFFACSAASCVGISKRPIQAQFCGAELVACGVVERAGQFGML